MTDKATFENVPLRDVGGLPDRPAMQERAALEARISKLEAENRALKKGSLQPREILDLGPIGMGITRPSDSRIIYTNRQIAAVLGQDPTITLWLAASKEPES